MPFERNLGAVRMLADRVSGSPSFHAPHWPSNLIGSYGQEGVDSGTKRVCQWCE